MPLQAEKIELNTAIRTAIETNDQNAAVLLDALSQDNNLTEITDMRHADGLSSYLASVYHGAARSQTYLLPLTSDESKKTQPQSGLALISKMTGFPVSFEGANDVVMAILSPDPDALKKLHSAYSKQPSLLSVNEKTIPASTAGFRNKEARKLAPLDVAVQYYISQHMFEQPFRDIQEQLGKSISRTLTPAIDFFKAASMEETVHSSILQGCDAFRTYSHETAAKIEQLIYLGATGSREAYFPANPKSLLDPFNDPDCFEAMSLKEFCRENSDRLPAALYQLITKSSAPSRQPGQ